MTSSPADVRLDRTASHTWALFVDWCSATGHVALPAQPETLAEFLADHPAQQGTHRRRVTVINSMHRQRGLPEPGRAHAVHAALATRRHQRLRAVADLLEERIRQLPVGGWPQGLFGRRDALILTLVTAGLTYTEIAALRRGDVRQQGHELVIDSARLWHLGPAAESAELGPVPVYSRWARVQEILDGFPNARMLAHYFERPPEPVADRPAPVLDAGAIVQPLIVSIDRWGYTPLHAKPISAQSIAAITSAHLSGEAPAHRRCTPLATTGMETAARPARDDSQEPTALDPRYYRRGVTARRRAHAWLTDVVDELDGVADRAEQLLEQLAAIVGDATKAPAEPEEPPPINRG
jgi:hypothetical protein